ncbi:MAG TPA: T9SS type A sorting domain-containing protein [Saprospiraceae bacterium]|nr:T9SS type A sorting domain-containing protein [Saprospiraceae bacterium]
MRMILLTLLLLCTFTSYSQPFNLQFGQTGDDFIYKVIPADSNQFFLLGSVRENGGNQIWLMKTDSTGNLLWSKSYGFNDPDELETGYTLLMLNDGQMLIAGDAGKEAYFYDRESILIKVDRDGNQIWKKYYQDISGLQDVQPEGNGFIAVGHQDRTAAILHVDSVGNEITKSYFQISGETVLHKIIPTTNNNYLMIGRANNIGAGYQGGFIALVNAQNHLLWYKLFETGNREDAFSGITEWFRPPMCVYQDNTDNIWIADPYGDQIGLFLFDTLGNQLDRKVYGLSQKDEWPTSLIPTTDGGWLMTGIFERDSSFAIKLNASGKQEWLKYYGRENHNAYTFSAVESGDHYLLSGMISDNHGDAPANGWLLGVEKDGNPFPYTIHLSLHYDIEGDCQYSAEDIPLPGWFITAIDSHRTTQLITDLQGNAIYQTDASETRFEYVEQNTKHFDLCHNTSWVYTSQQNPEKTDQNLVLKQSNCAEIEVGLTQPDLVQCDTSTFWITLVNRGVKLSDETTLRFEYDTSLTIIELSEDYSIVPGGVNITIPPIESIGGEYRIFGRVVLSCDVQLGATHRMKAVLLSPNCELAYNGPRYAISGTCSGDQIRFSLSNEGGGGTQATAAYNLYVNDLPMIHEQSVIVPEGGNKIIFEYPADGRTWRMELLPDAAEPNQRKRVATVEGCGRLNTGLYNVGFTNGFSSGPADIKSSEVYVMNSVGIPDAIAEAMPGMLEENVISSLEPLEFTASTKNKTGHMVNEVVFDLNFVRGLDMTTFHILASNEKVKLELISNSVLRATMQNLFLLPGDDAMIRFRVEPNDSLIATVNGTDLLVKGNAFLDGEGPVALMSGDHEYIIDDPERYAGYADYPPEMLIYSGRRGDFTTGFSRDINGNLFIVGSSDSYSENFLHYGFVIKTNSEGKVIWQKMIFIEGTEINVSAAIPTDDGGCFVVGDLYYLKDPEGYINFHYGLTARLDAEGNVLWHKVMRPAGEQAGTYFRGGFMSSDGQVIIYGVVRSGDDHTLILKMNLDGNIIWQYYQTSDMPMLSPYEGINLKNGGYAFWGELDTSIDSRPSVLTLDAAGKFKGTKTYTFKGDGYGGGLAITPDHGFLVMGYGEKDTLSTSVIVPKLIKTDSLGVKQWEKHLWFGEGVRVEGYTIIPAIDGGYLIGGIIDNHLPDHDDDMFLGKIDEHANLEWYRYFGNENYERVSSLINNVTDEIWVLGINQIRSRFDKIQSLLIKTNADGVTDVKPVREEKQLHVLLFPNPVEDILNVILTPAPDDLVNWVIRDLSGKIMDRGRENATDPFNIQMDDIAAGIYIITFPGSHFQTKKFIVVR